MEHISNAPDYIAHNLPPRTLAAVAELHADQKARPDGTPYPEHPLAVARNVLQAADRIDSEKIIAALLHDAVEDQAPKLVAKAIEANITSGDERSLALSYIELQFGARPARIISQLTNPDFGAALRSQGQAVTAEGKNKLYAEHVFAAIQDPEVLPVKLFDFAANGLRLEAVADPARRRKLAQKYAPVVHVFIHRLTDGRPTGIKPAIQSQILANLIQARADMEAWLQD